MCWRHSYKTFKTVALLVSKNHAGLFETRKTFPLVNGLEAFSYEQNVFFWEGQSLPLASLCVHGCLTPYDNVIQTPTSNFETKLFWSPHADFSRVGELLPPVNGEMVKCFWKPWQNFIQPPVTDPLNRCLHFTHIRLNVHCTKPFV